MDARNRTKHQTLRQVDYYRTPHAVPLLSLLRPRVGGRVYSIPEYHYFQEIFHFAERQPKLSSSATVKLVWNVRNHPGIIKAQACHEQEAAGALSIPFYIARD